MLGATAISARAAAARAAWMPLSETVRSLRLCAESAAAAASRSGAASRAAGSARSVGSSTVPSAAASAVRAASAPAASSSPASSLASSLLAAWRGPSSRFSGPVRGWGFSYSSSRSWTRGPWDPNRTLYGLLGANVVGWALWGFAPDLMYRHATVSAESALKRPWTLVTAAFSQRDTSHLLVNGLGLYFFGRHVGSCFGGRKLLGIYLLGAVAGSVAHALQAEYRASQRSSSWGKQTERSRIALGASAAVNAVVAASLLEAPYASIYIYGIVPVPAFLFGVGYLLWDIAGASGRLGSDGIGHLSHLAGAAAGAAAFYAITKRGPGGGIRGYRF